MQLSELLLPIATVLITLFAFYLGEKVRVLVNVIIPIKDPVSWLIFLGIFALYLIPCLVDCGWESDNIYLVACTLGFIPMYMIGYYKAGIDKEFVAVHNIIDIRQGEIARPLVIYYNKNGQQCYQPQDIKGILKRLVFGVHCPLELNRGMVKRRRTIDIAGDYLKIKVEAIDAVEMTPTEIEVNKVRIGTYKANRHGVVRDGHQPGEPRYLFHFTAEARKYTISPTETNEPTDYYVNGAIADHVMKRYEGLMVKSMDDEIKLRTQGIEQGAKILTHQADLTPGSYTFQQVLGNLKQDIEVKRKVEAMKKAENDRQNDEARENGNRN